MADYYTYSLDIWSVGCIFGELLGMMKENFANFTERKPLFPGHACFPLSPSGGDKDDDDEDKHTNDQLGKIFDVIGTPPLEEDYMFINSEKSLHYLRSFSPREGVNLQEVYPGADNRAIELLKGMLTFNPDKRITAEQAIADDYFDDIRLPEQEVTTLVPNKVNLEVDEKDDLPIEEMHRLIK